MATFPYCNTGYHGHCCLQLMSFANTTDTSTVHLCKWQVCNWNFDIIFQHMYSLTPSDHYYHLAAALWNHYHLTWILTALLAGDPSDPSRLTLAVQLRSCDHFWTDVFCITPTYSYCSSPLWSSPYMMNTHCFISGLTFRPGSLMNGIHSTYILVNWGHLKKQITALWIRNLVGYRAICSPNTMKIVNMKIKKVYLFLFLFFFSFVKGAFLCASMEIHIIEGTFALILKQYKAHFDLEQKIDHLFFYEIFPVWTWRVNIMVHSVKLSNQGAVHFF